MKRVELMVVEERFQLSGIGMALAPDFPMPDGWKNVAEQVLVVAPDGREITTQAQFNKTHFNFGDAPAEGRRERTWRVVVALLDVGKDAVPVGSSVWVSPATHSAVFGADPGRR